MLWGITLVILGLLAVPSIVLSRKPNAKEIFNKVAPYQGWIGLVFAVIGVISLIQCLFAVGKLGVTPLAWLIWLLTAAVETGLGFILGYSMIHKYALSKNAAAQEKGAKVLSRLLPMQGTLGVIAIVIGIIQIVSSIIWF